jgi:hypothetical protein
MNADRFTFYIKNPAHLYQITYTELKSLVLQYPYCQNLRYLLLKKSILENHQEADRNLQLAATFSNDRNFLYQQIKDGDSYLSEADSFLLKEDYLELKELQPEHNIKDNVNITPLTETEQNLGDSNTDNTYKISMEASEINVSLPPTEEIIPDLEAPHYFEETDEEELIDITNEMEGIFVEIDTPTVDSTNNTELEAKEYKSSIKNEEEIVEDEAISIEELIKLDSLSPLERMEKSKPIPKTKKKNKNKADNTEMKNKISDFEKIDALIEKTKKDVPLEITNKEVIDLEKEHKPKPSPKSSFGSWLKQFQPPEEKTEKEETFIIPESKKKTPKQKKAKKKKKKTDKIKKGKEVKGKIKKNKEKVIDTAEVKKIPEKAKKVAAKSLTQNSEIASETLAKLLVKQKNYTEALKMYEKLSLIFPEKSSFFADQIKKLKNL